MKWRNWISLNPFSIIFIILALGVMCADYFEFSTTISSIICAISAISLVVSIYVRSAGVAISYLYTAIFIFGIALTVTSIQKAKDYLPDGEYLDMSISIDNSVTTRGRWQRVYGTLDSYSADGGRKVSSGQRIAVNIDTARRVVYGDLVECSGYLNSISTESGYGRLMANRGVFKSTYVVADKVKYVSNGTNKGVIYYAKLAQQGALERLQRLNLSENSLAIVSAMSIGDKSLLTSELKSAYSQSGVSHILAVSGLHIGIVTLLINIILNFMPLLGMRGLFYKSAIGVVVIWLFAIMSGLSPSVIRAATMFSIAHVAYATSQTYSSFNVIAATAAIMLCLNPMWLFDISFQLSFVATASLALMVSPIYNKLRGENRMTNKLLSAIITSSVATIGTAPLVAYYFNIIPTYAFIVNIPVIALAYVVVQSALIWIVLPWHWLNLPMHYTLSYATDGINYIVGLAASLPYATISCQPTTLHVVVCYVLFLGSVVLLGESPAYRDRGFTER